MLKFINYCDRSNWRERGVLLQAKIFNTELNIIIMKSKSLIMAVAAFAVTATGAHAYTGTDILEKAGLSQDQIEAVQEARELRQSGEIEEARDVLIEAGISADTLRSIRESIREHRQEFRHEHREEVREAVEEGDYEAFKEAVAGLPLADKITSEADFNLLVEAHELRQAGDLEAAKEIMDQLGLGSNAPGNPGHGMHQRLMSELSDEQRVALREAHQNRDREAVRNILDEAGVSFPNLAGLQRSGR